jgi:hypothetical protein
MFVVRATAVGGLVLVAVTSQAAHFPFIPHAVYLKMETFAVLQRMLHRPESTTNGIINPGPVTHGVTPVAAVAPTKPNTFWTWLDTNFWEKLDITGSRTLGFHAINVSGDTTAYDEATNYGEGGQEFTDDGSLSITGRKVLGVLSFQADIPDNRLSDPTTQQYLLEYDRGPWKISEGDIRGSLLTGNSLLDFSRSLHGSMVEYQKGPLHVKALYSETKGTAQTVSIQGSNSEGPYYLESGRVLPDTLSVMVDGVLMRSGTDYVLNGESGDSGSITFLSRVIPPTSTIVATFESVSPGSSPGILAGAGATYNLGKFGQVGATLVEQLSTGTSGDGSNPDLFEFTGPSSTEYPLTYLPIASTVVVQLGGLILTPGTFVNGVVTNGQWALNPADLQQLYLSPTLNGIVGTTTVYVKYMPAVTQTVNGDRQVYGFDYEYKFGKLGLIQYAQATGRTVNTADEIGSTARTLNGNYLWKGINFTAIVKDIPDDFVSIETEGFARNEESYTLGADVKKSRFDYGLTYGNSMVDDQTTTSTSTGTTGTTGTTSSVSNFNARSTSAKAYASYNAADGTTWSLAETRTAGHQVYDSELEDTSFTGLRPIGKQIKLDTGIEYQVGRGPLVNSAGDTVIGDVDLLTYHVGATYIPIPKLTIDGKLSVSQTRALGQTSAGDDISFDASWRPSDKWTASVKMLNSSSGQSATLSGFSNGTGDGYSGNGFSSGPAGSGYLGAADGQLDTRTALVTYKASARFSLDTHYSENYATGSLTDNSDVTDLGVGIQWDLGQVTVASFSMDQTNSEFIDSTTFGSAQNTSVSFNLTAAPKGKWFYQFGFNSLLAGGESTYAQNTLSYNLGLGYKLSKKHQVNVTYIQSSLAGFDGQENDQFVLTYTYSIFQRLGLALSYRIDTVSNTDPTETTGAYRAAGFDVDLTYGFKT